MTRVLRVLSDDPGAPVLGAGMTEGGCLGRRQHACGDAAARAHTVRVPILHNVFDHIRPGGPGRY
jgi:hypothetical protein